MRIDFIQEIIDIIRHKKIEHLDILVNKKLGYDNTPKENIKTLILGSSHLYYGYLAQEGEFNFAVPSQDLYNNYEMYKYLNTPYVKNVVVSFSVFTPGVCLIRTVYAKYCILYKMLFDISYQTPEFAKKKNLFLYETRYKKEIKKHMANPGIDVRNYLGNSTEYPEQKFHYDSVNILASKHYKNNQRPNHQMEYCDKLIEETAKNNQNIYFVISPHVKEYRECLPPSEELFKTLYKACEGHGHAKIINMYANDETFLHDDYWDVHHLNHTGAQKLTDIIRKEIAR